jgi:hypothetical protein
LSNSGKADHPAIRHKEDMTIDKEDINACENNAHARIGFKLVE